MKKFSCILPLVLLISACQTVTTTPRPDSYYGAYASGNDSKPLFKSEATALTDSDIDRIINYRLTLPKQNRIAILSLSGANLWRFYSNDFAQLNETIEQDFIGKLKSSNRVYDASFLPTLLVPENRTVPYLREAAARYQADLVLAYRTRCASYDKFRLLRPDETRAYCAVETVLLDVRTGIVPFTSVSMNNVETTKSPDDKTLAETVKKNELTAISKSLSEAAKSLVQFLDRIPIKQ